MVIQTSIGDSLIGFSNDSWMDWWVTELWNKFVDGSLIWSFFKRYKQSNETTFLFPMKSNNLSKKWNQKSLQWSDNRAGTLHENICQARREKFIFLSQVFVHVQNIHWLVDKMFKFWELKINEQIKSMSWSSVTQRIVNTRLPLTIIKLCTSHLKPPDPPPRGWPGYCGDIHFMFTKYWFPGSRGIR